MAHAIHVHQLTSFNGTIPQPSYNERVYISEFKKIH